MYNDLTNRNERLNNNDEPFNSDINFGTVLMVIGIMFIIVSYFVLSTSEFKLEKCQAFNNNNQAVIDCYFNN